MGSTIWSEMLTGYGQNATWGLKDEILDESKGQLITKWHELAHYRLAADNQCVAWAKGGGGASKKCQEDPNAWNNHENACCLPLLWPLNDTAPAWEGQCLGLKVCPAR